MAQQFNLLEYNRSNLATRRFLDEWQNVFNMSDLVDQKRNILLVSLRHLQSKLYILSTTEIEETEEAIVEIKQTKKGRIHTRKDKEPKRLRTKQQQFRIYPIQQQKKRLKSKRRRVKWKYRSSFSNRSEVRIEKRVLELESVLRSLHEHRIQNASRSQGTTRRHIHSLTHSFTPRGNFSRKN